MHWNPAMTATVDATAQGTIGALGARVAFDRIEKRYGTVVAVDEVSLDIEPGEFITLLGQDHDADDAGRVRGADRR